jgi:colanic acid/amylovoran biosynthesis glycosyltransferase
MNSPTQAVDDKTPPLADANKRPIKLMYVVGTYPELSNTFIDREVGQLRGRGFDLQTLAIRRPTTLAATLPEYQHARDTTIYLLPQNWLEFIGAHLRYALTHPMVYFGTLLSLFCGRHPSFKLRLMTPLHFALGVYAAHKLRDREFDHLHVHFIDRAVVVALVAGRLLNKPYSLTAHAYSIFAKQILLREKIANSRFSVTVSKFNRRYLVDNFGADAEKIHIFHPWVDPALFEPPAERTAHEKLHIFSCGRLVEKKGHDYLVEACKLLRDRGIDFECRIAGGGPLLDEISALVTRYDLGGHVNLLGEVPSSEVRENLTSWANVFALACCIAKNGDRDGIPVALAEAMAMELPVVSCDVAGVVELVQPGTGLMVPPQDPTALAKALEDLNAKGHKERLVMGRRGRQVVEEEFNLPKSTAELGELFRRMIESEDRISSRP